MSGTGTEIGVLGGGSWGTALAVHWALTGRRVRLWARSEEVCAALRRGENARYLPGVAIPAQVTATSELAALAGCEPLVMVVPSHGYRAVLRRLLEALPHDGSRTVVSATKGVEVDSLDRMSQVTAEEGERARLELRFAALSGPSFAAELVADSPTAVVIAAQPHGLAAELRSQLATRTLRLYSSDDVVGVEIGGAAKNVVAIAAGAVEGLGLGHNTLAALITRGLHEITRLGMACGGRAQTLSGLAGLGDLVLTCTGGLSRNQQTGVELARGRTVGEIRRATGMVAEGVRNSLSIARLAHRLGVEMPITEQMVQVLHHGKSPRAALDDLMRRDLKAESEL
ncbi:MAG TPA: NAD(P)H-dependent glycerol-3-phosphate dehydrogenase [Thermoanaerobaculia bacterium]|nr:NAD(P)H-dependent glycerol-3-phosphate dehydrogenase [Thermoanaerobaculia bacterium]